MLVYNASFSFVAEEKKNQHAVSVVERILDNCTWINIHTLPVRMLTTTVIFTITTITLTITAILTCVYTCYNLMILFFSQHDIRVVEVRTVEGYGARWQLLPESQFRGFLEPQMKDGHSVHWKH